MKILLAPNGKRIVGTAERMLTTRGIEVTGKNPDGSIAFEYNDVFTNHSETEEQRKDWLGHRLFTDESGVDWPEHKLTIQEVAEERT